MESDSGKGEKHVSMLGCSEGYKNKKENKKLLLDSVL